MNLLSSLQLVSQTFIMHQVYNEQHPHKAAKGETPFFMHYATDSYGNNHVYKSMKHVCPHACGIIPIKANQSTNAPMWAHMEIAQIASVEYQM